MCDLNKGPAAYGYNNYEVVLPASNGFSIDFYEKILRERELFLDELLLLSCCGGLDDFSSKNEIELACTSPFVGCANKRKLTMVDENFVKSGINSALPPMKRELLDYFNTVVIPEVTARWNSKASESLESDNSVDFDYLFDDEAEEILDECSQPTEEEKLVNKSFQERMVTQHESSAFTIQEVSKIANKCPCNEPVSQKREPSHKLGSIDDIKKHAESNKLKAICFHEPGFNESFAWGNFIANTIDSSSGTSDEDDFVIIDNCDSSVKSNNTSACIDDLSPDEDYNLFNDDPAVIDFIRNIDDSEFHRIIQSCESKITKGANDSENCVHDGGGSSLQIPCEETSVDPTIFINEHTSSVNYIIEESIGHNVGVRIYDDKTEHIQIDVANNESTVAESCANAEIVIAGSDLVDEAKHDILMESANYNKIEEMETHLNKSNGAMEVDNAEDINFFVTQIVDDVALKMDYVEHGDDVEIIKYIDNSVVNVKVISVTEANYIKNKEDGAITINSDKAINDHDELAIIENTAFDISFTMDDGDYNGLIITPDNSDNQDDDGVTVSDVEDATSTEIVDIDIGNNDSVKESIIKLVDHNAMVETFWDHIAVEFPIEKDYGENSEDISPFKSIENTCQIDNENQLKDEVCFLTEIAVTNVTKTDRISLSSLISQSTVLPVSPPTVVSAHAFKSVTSTVHMSHTESFENCLDIARFSNQSIDIKNVLSKPGNMLKLMITHLAALHKSLSNCNSLISNNVIHNLIGYTSGIVWEINIQLGAEIAEIVKKINMNKSKSAFVSSHDKHNIYHMCHLKDSFNVVCGGGGNNVLKDSAYNADYYNCKIEIERLLIGQTNDWNSPEPISNMSVSKNLREPTILQSTSGVANWNLILNGTVENYLALDCLNFPANHSKATINDYRNDARILTVENDDANEEDKCFIYNNLQGEVMEDYRMAELNGNVDTLYRSPSAYNSDFKLEGREERNTYFPSCSNGNPLSVAEEIKEHSTVGEISTSQSDRASIVRPNVDSEVQLHDLSFEVGVFDIFFSEDDDENSEALCSSPSTKSAEASPDFLEKMYNMTFDYIGGDKSVSSTSQTTDSALPELEKLSTVKANKMLFINQKTLAPSINKKMIDLDDPFSFLSVKDKVLSLYGSGLLSCNSNAAQAVPECSINSTGVLLKDEFAPDEIIPVIFSGELLEVAQVMETFSIPVIKKLLATEKFGFSPSLTLENITSDLTYFSLNQEMKFCQDNGIDLQEGGIEGSNYYLLLVLHGVIKALEILIHVDLSASVQCLKEFQLLHDSILKNCYKKLLNKMSCTLTKLCYDNVVHPKIECTSSFLAKAYNQSTTCHIEYKVLIIVQRGLQIVFPLLKSSISDILSDVDVVLIPESVYLENCPQIVRNKKNCIFVATALSLSRNGDWSQFTLIVEYESREEFCFWKNVCQGSKIAFSSVRVQNLNFKTFQTIKDLMTFETDLHENVKETEEVIIIASETVTRNGDLLKLFETKGNITVISRDYERWLPDLFFPDIDINSSISILLVTLNCLQEREFVDNLLNKIFSFHVKYDTCWIIFHEVQKEKHPNRFCRSKIESNLWQVYMASRVITSRFEHYNIKILFAESNDQILYCVKSIMNIVHSSPAKKREASLQALFSYDMTQVEVFLMSFPCINSFRAQAMLPFSMHKLFAMNVDELMSHFPSFPLRIVELFYSMTHPFVDEDASSEVDFLESCPESLSINSDASNESLPIIDNQLLEYLNNTPSSPESDIDDPQPLINMSLEEIDRNYVSLKFGHDSCNRDFSPYNLHSDSNSYGKKSPYNLHSKFNYQRVKSPYEKHLSSNSSKKDPFYELHSTSDFYRGESSPKVHSSSDYHVRESSNELAGASSHHARRKISSYKLLSTSNHYYMKEPSCEISNISNPLVPESSCDLPSTSTHYVKNTHYKLPSTSNQYVKNSIYRSNHHVKKVSPMDSTVHRISKNQHMLNSVVSDTTECPRSNFDDLMSLSMKRHKCSNEINSRNTFSGNAPVENRQGNESSLFLHQNTLDNSSHFQPRHTFYSLDNNLKSFSHHKDADVFIEDRDDAPMHSAQHIHQSTAKATSRYFKNPPIGGLKLKYTRPSTLPGNKIGVVSPMVLPDMESPPMDLDGALPHTLVSSLRVKFGNKRGKDFSDDECVKDCGALSPVRKQRKLTYERTRGRKGQTTLIFQ